MPTTLTGEVERVTFENEETSFRVIRLGSVEGLSPSPGQLAVVGTFQAVGPGTRVRVTGELVTDPKHGRQLRVESLVPVAPSTLVGLERYLGSGLIKGVGPKLAARIVKKFGMDALSVLDTDPRRLAEVPGIGAQRAQDVQEAWTAQHGISNVMVLLQTHGASPALAVRIYRRYGARAAAMLQQHPYRLALEVAGIGFKTADRLAQSLGIAGDHPERAQAGTLHELGQYSDAGHVYALREDLERRAAELLGIDEAHVQAAIDALWASGRVVVEGDRVYSARLHAAESRIAEGLRQLLASPGPALGGVEKAIEHFERSQNIVLAPQQRAAVAAVCQHRVVVVTGGPGVGKTTIVRAIASVLAGARLTLDFATPTGRAAKRLSEATGRPARTIHRLLEVDPKTGRFKRDSELPLELDALILDEASMIDVSLAAALIDALPPDCRLVIVGDADQLPSVGPGAFLRDVIASGVVPTVRLTEIFRQASESRIVQNAHRILRGQLPETAQAEDVGADFFVIPKRDPEEAAEVVRELVETRIPRRFGLDPIRDIQVLTPMHKGPAGTIALNALLQSRLNATGASLTVRDQVYRVGDKVMQTRNDYERDVYNGDVGAIVTLDPRAKVAVVSFDDRLVQYDEAAIDQLVLAYATSIHKSQGSEYPAVVIPMLTAHFVMLNQNLLYTAVTRARRLCVLVSDTRALRLALSDERRDVRRTSLAERLGA